MRIVNRVLAVAAALGLAAGGVVVIIEIALASAGRGPWLVPYDSWYRSARTNHWDSSGARTLFLALALAGAIMVILQVVKPRPRSIPLEPGVARAGVARRSLERALARTVGNETGVATATARIRRRRARVVAATVAPPDELRPRLEEAAHAHLRDLGLDGRLRVAVDIHPRNK